MSAESMAKPVPGTAAQAPKTSADTLAEMKLFLRTLPNYRDLKELLLTSRDNVFTEEEVTKAWFDVTVLVKEYSDDRVEQWKGEIDNYLFFAGLFSAILTAFNVECFSFLQPTVVPADTALAILRHISSQLSSFSSSPPYINSSQPPFSTISDIILDAANSPQQTPFFAILLNILLFASLMFSLCSAFLGILVLQWLKTFSGELSGDSHVMAWLRQNRLNNLQDWHIEHFVGAVPLLLQISLLLFLAGLLVLLWTLNLGVFGVVCGLMVVLACVFIGTTILPLMRRDCAYLSPQTFGLYFAWRYICQSILVSLKSRGAPCVGSQDGPSPHRPSDSTSPPAAPPSSPLEQSPEGDPHPDAAGGLGVQTWQSQERSLLESPEVCRRLDIDILHTAYNSTLDAKTLATSATCLIRGDPEDIVKWFRRLDLSVSVKLDEASDDVGLGAGVSTAFTLGGHGARTVLWAIVLRSMIKLLKRKQGPRDEYAVNNWRRAALQLKACLASAYRYVRMSLAITVILWRRGPEQDVSKEQDASKDAKGTFSPNDMALQRIKDSLHDLLHRVLDVRQSDPHKANIISPGVAELGVVIAFRKLVFSTEVIASGLPSRPAVTIADWFYSACAAIDWMAIFSQLSPTVVVDKPVLFLASAQLRYKRAAYDCRKHIDPRDIPTLGRHTLFCLNVGLLFYAADNRRSAFKLVLTQLLDIFSHLLQNLADHAPLFGPLMPPDLPHTLTRFNTALVELLNSTGMPEQRGAVKPLSALLQYTLARIQIVNFAPRGG
ncbi:hypothetical protein BN946_scf184851.g14 [Trametes cinnabarina]|uniref:DUF6535 domain-containing protein n=1 Tax=Pycnoporus cinnabarinus TaxID=5643 RepID=A0A060S5Y3_PYCCI|nr:hypothetical protein BN946_scf184851.g14 [Trametes cinnabarina]